MATRVRVVAWFVEYLYHTTHTLHNYTTTDGDEPSRVRNHHHWWCFAFRVRSRFRATRASTSTRCREWRVASAKRCEMRMRYSSTSTAFIWGSFVSFTVRARSHNTHHFVVAVHSKTVLCLCRSPLHYWYICTKLYTILIILVVGSVGTVYRFPPLIVFRVYMRECVCISYMCAII